MRSRTKVALLVLLAIAVPAALAAWHDDDPSAAELPEDDETWA